MKKYLDSFKRLFPIQGVTQKISKIIFSATLPFVFLAVFFALPSAANAATYYVSTSGNDSNPGTLASPWRLINYAVSRVTAGDTIYIRGGTYSGEYINLGVSGTSSAPITMDAYNGETVIIDGIDQAGTGIYIDEAYWHIYHLTLTRYNAAVYYRDGAHSSHDNDVGYMTITNGNSGGSGAYFVGTYNNSIHHSKIGGGWGWSLVKVEGGTAYGQSRNITIEANEIYDPATHGPIDLSGDFTNIKIYGNTIYGGPSEAIYIHQTALDGYPNSGYIDIYNNTIYNTCTFIMFDDPASHSVIRNNTLTGPVNCGGRMIKILDSMQDVSINYNTITGASYTSQIYTNASDSTLIGNNATAPSGTVEYAIQAPNNTLIDSVSNTGTYHVDIISGATPAYIKYTNRNFTVDSVNYTAGTTVTLNSAKTYTVTYGAETNPTTVSDPTFSPAAGTYTSTQSVSISSVTTGATIYYTTNGTTPTTSSSVYSSPLTVSSTTTIKALAVKSGLTNSAVTTAVYTISSPVLTSITLSPSTASLGLGSTQQFTATPKDQFGNTMTGITISWTSSSTGVATINSSGLATGVAIGSSTITASSGGISATAPLTVSAFTSPTLINEYETAWNTTTSPKATAAFDALSGDVLVAYAMAEDAGTSVNISGGSLTWTQQQVVNVSQYAWLSIWTATVDTNKNMSVSFTQGGTAGNFGGNVLLFRNASIGASGKSNASGAPTLNLTTTQANSAIVVASADWSALDGATRAWRANAGAFSEKTYTTVSYRYTVYGGYHANAGAIGTYAVGLSSPTGQKYSIAAIEIKGVASPSFSPSDINQDGSINILDLNTVAQHFNETTSIPYPAYDVNSDGRINILDIQAVARNI